MNRCDSHILVDKTNSVALFDSRQLSSLNYSVTKNNFNRLFEPATSSVGDQATITATASHSL